MADDAGSQDNGGGGGSSASPQVIVVKKKNRGGGHGHHGGAWKVAYADFVTAMMAFFLLLWLLASTTEEQKAGIAHYFNPPNNSTQYGGGSGIMAGSSVIDANTQAPAEMMQMPPTETSNDDLAVQAKEDAMFRQVADEMKKAVMNIPQLKALLDNMLIDVTPEGLRISITDREGRELFADSSATMQPYTQQLLGVVGSVLAKLPNRLALGAHTDVAPYHPMADMNVPATYTNWELSADRAQAMRRVLEQEGLPDRRFQRVAGFAGSELMLPDQPTHMKNRRLTIIVLRSKRGTVAQFSQDGLLAPEAGNTVGNELKLPF